MNWLDGRQLEYQTTTNAALSPGTAGCPPAGRPARGPPPTGSCWWRPARPAGPCTPGGRGQTPACSRCAAARWWWAEIRCSRKQDEGGKLYYRNNSKLSETSCFIHLLPPWCAFLNLFLPVEVVVVQLVSWGVVVVVVVSPPGFSSRAQFIGAWAVGTPVSQRQVRLHRRPVGRGTNQNR